MEALQNLSTLDWFHELPVELQSRGIDAEMWSQWMAQLLSVQQNHSAHDCLRCFHCLTILFLPVFCFLSCFRCSAADPFQTGMHEWLRSCNAVLEPKGMYVKAFCFKQMNEQGQYWNDGTLATINFALTNEEVERLKRKPVLQQGLSHDPFWACFCCPHHADRAV